MRKARKAASSGYVHLQTAIDGAAPSIACTALVVKIKPARSRAASLQKLIFFV
jgi:hypothetical protein